MEVWGSSKGHFPLYKGPIVPEKVVTTSKRNGAGQTVPYLIKSFFTTDPKRCYADGSKIPTLTDISVTAEGARLHAVTFIPENSERRAPFHLRFRFGKKQGVFTSTRTYEFQGFEIANRRTEY